MDIEQMKAREDVDGLIAALDRPGYRVAAARALGELGQRYAVVPLTRLLFNPNQALNQALTEALDRLGSAHIHRELLPVLKDPRAKPALRENAAVVLAMHPAETLTEPLIEAASDRTNDDSLRDRVMIALGAVAMCSSVQVKTRILQALTDLRTDGNQRIRASAADTIESIRLVTQGPTPGTP